MQLVASGHKKKTPVQVAFFSNKCILSSILATAHMCNAAHQKVELESLERKEIKGINVLWKDFFLKGRHVA